MTVRTLDTPSGTDRLLSVVSVAAGDGDGTDDEVMRWGTAINGWTDWMVANGCRPQTVRMRRYQIRRLAEAHLRRSPWRVTGRDLVTWLAGQQWAPETRKSNRAALRSFYRWGRSAKLTRSDPTVDLGPVRVPPRAARPAPTSVFKAALSAADDMQRMLLLLAAFAGLRRAEIAGLRWDQIGDEQMRITGKGGRERMLWLHPALRTELMVERARRQVGGHGGGFRRADTTWMFPGRRDGHLRADTIGRVGSRLLGAGWSLHRLRARFLTDVHHLGGDLLLTQQLAGHASPVTTRGYVAVDQSRAAEIISRLT